MVCRMNMQFQMQDFESPFYWCFACTSVMSFYVWKQWNKSDIDNFRMFARFRFFFCIAQHDDGSVLQAKLPSRGEFLITTYAGVHLENKSRSMSIHTPTCRFKFSSHAFFLPASSSPCQRLPPGP